MRKPMGVIRRNAMVGSAKIYNSELEISQEDIITNLKSQLAKCDQLLEQVYPWIKDPSAIPFVRVRLQWLKQVEELKGGK